MKNFEIEIKYPVGTIFEDKCNFFTSDKKTKFKIDKIEVFIDKNIRKVYHVLEYSEYFCCKDNPHWRATNRTYTEAELSKLIKESVPQKINIEFKYEIGDICISGTNGIIPHDTETWKDSGPFCGKVFEILERSATIYKDNVIRTKVDNYRLIYSSGQIYTKEDNKIQYGWSIDERVMCKVSEVDWDKVIDYKCKEFSKKMWRDDPYKCLFKEDGSPIMNNYNSSEFENDFTGLFYYLKKEDQARDLYFKYVEDRIEGRFNKKFTKIDDIINSLTESEKEELLKKLMKKMKTITIDNVSYRPSKVSEDFKGIICTQCDLYHICSTENSLYNLCDETLKCREVFRKIE